MMPPEEVTLKEYMDAMLKAAEKEREALRLASSDSTKSILLALRDIDKANSDKLADQDKRITVIEVSVANYQGKLWMIGAILGGIVILANLASPWVQKIIL